MSEMEVKVKSEDLNKYIEKIKEIVDPLIDKIETNKLPKYMKAFEHIVNPEYSTIADVYRKNDPMETYLSNNLLLMKLINIQVRGSGLLGDYGLKRLAADTLKNEYENKLETIDGEKVEMTDDIRIKGYYVAAKTICESAVFRVDNKRDDKFNPSEVEIIEYSEKDLNQRLEKISNGKKSKHNPKQK